MSPPPPPSPPPPVRRTQMHGLVRGAIARHAPIGTVTLMPTGSWESVSSDRVAPTRHRRRGKTPGKRVQRPAPCEVMAKTLSTADVASPTAPSTTSSNVAAVVCPDPPLGLCLGLGRVADALGDRAAVLEVEDARPPRGAIALAQQVCAHRADGRRAAPGHDAPQWGGAGIGAVRSSCRAHTILQCLPRAEEGPERSSKHHSFSPQATQSRSNVAVAVAAAVEPPPSASQ